MIELSKASLWLALVVGAWLLSAGMLHLKGWDKDLSSDFWTVVVTGWTAWVVCLVFWVRAGKK